MGDDWRPSDLADRLWEALKRECCSTRPDSPDWPKVGKIVTVRKANVVAALSAALPAPPKEGT